MIKSYKSIFPWILISAFTISAFAQSDSAVIKKLSNKADVILTGKVTKKESGWNESKTRIYTKATLQVDEVLKGNNNQNYVEIISPGGEVGDVGELYTHMPRFDKDEEVLVFLKKDHKNGLYKVLNGEAGKITVLEDSKTREKVTRSHVRVKDLKAKIKGFLKGQ
ncbi:MAG: hypothetical protein P8Y60_01900 [Calditrichota bacterium]|jgi:hypothetical protein